MAVRHTLRRDNVEFHAAGYDDPPPPITDRDIVIVDFSYKRLVFDEIAREARTVLVLHHHYKTAAEELRGFLYMVASAHAAPGASRPSRRRDWSRGRRSGQTYAPLWFICTPFRGFRWRD
jgi:hypothetical protein